ncbi:MAG: hypothetical protein IPH84_03535 [Bacteroidales bacterium]|nr:hypothetical protein [Bacteroidales bacterium]
MRYWLVITLTILSCRISAQTYEISTTDKSNQDYYPWITFLSEGETSWNSDDETGFAYRLIITTSEIYNDILIEKTSCGSEGGNKTILWRRLINTDELIKALNIEGEFSDVTFINWISWDSFQLKISDKKIQFEDLESKDIKIKKIE